ncbi:MAG: stage 0 sporulation protein [Clostridiales bacterium]|nr:stage 0 sporulation protein [Clostridiales bacterium]
MIKTVNVIFREGGKTYRFSCEGMNLHVGDAVMVDTALGIDLAHVVSEPVEIEEPKDSDELAPVVRLAEKSELDRYELKKEKEKEAYDKCLQLIEKHKLDMNLVDAVFAFDGKKVIFYFTSDNRVDFRELVKDLAAAFRARIELRQIGSRDQAKLVGGLGICGRELCCCTFLNQFSPVTLRMARDQGVSLNPSKLNGACGRLMCCLQFEKEAYADAHRRLPKVGKKIRTPHGFGVVSDVNLIEEKVSVRFTNEDSTEEEVFEWSGLEPLNPELHASSEEDCSKCNKDCPSKKNRGEDDAE